MKIILRAIAVAYACLAFFSSAYAEQFRDYYSEPGLHPFKDSLNQSINEHIDPFSGKLQLSYLDLNVPGNGGLDINITRNYLSRENWVDPYTVTGEGWTMHQGRIVVNNRSRDKICTQSTWSVNSSDNPSIELPDGSRHTLYYYNDQATAYLVTKTRWKARCNTPAGLIVTAPNGTEYIMDQYGYESNDGGITALVSYYTTQIKDLHGNIIDISYKDSYGLVRIDTITASDGRSVQFNYIGEVEGTGLILLDNITANGQVWQYRYTDIPNNFINNKQLTEVIRPDGTKWQYAYHPQYSAAGEAGSYSLKTVFYPSGGTITYTYKPVNFDWEATDYYTTVVATKTTGGRDITPGIWTFDYEPANPTAGRDYDMTTVTAPNGKYVYEHYGYNSPIAGTGNLWAVGLLYKKYYYDANNNLIQSEQKAWDFQVISDETYIHSRNKMDMQTRVPLLKQTYITRDGTSYATDYLNYDIYGNAGQIVETGNNVTRTTDYTYHIDTTNWIVNQVEDETLVGVGTIDRTFNTNGTLRSESTYGVLTEYTYHPSGDLETITNARGLVLNYQTKYNDYYRGIPREEIHPVTDTLNITLRRTVNDTGTVETQTNGRGFTTSFTYDGLNRLKTIDFSTLR